MSISVAILSAIEEQLPKVVETLSESALLKTAAVAQDEVITTLSDDAVRREVFESVRWDLEEVSMLEIHKIMDSLIEVLKGTDSDGSQ